MQFVAADVRAYEFIGVIILTFHSTQLCGLCSTTSHNLLPISCSPSEHTKANDENDAVAPHLRVRN